MDAADARDVTTRGQTLGIVVDGRAGAPWVAFSNSLATDLHLWDSQVEALRHDWRILRYDLRGHGGSASSVDAVCNTEVLADDLLAVMDAAGAARVHHIGVSMGALAGVAAASRRPERFASIVVCNSRLRSNENSAADLDRRAERAIAQGMASLIEPTLQKWFGQARLPLDDSVRQRVAGMIANTRPSDFAAYARGMRGYDLENKALRLPMPVLLLAGGDDGLVGADFQSLSSRNLAIRCVLIDGAGHLPNLQAEQEFNAHLVEFLQSTHEQSVADLTRNLAGL